MKVVSLSAVHTSRLYLPGSIRTKAYSCAIMYRLGNSLEKSSNTKFHEIRSVGAELFDRDKETDGGQTDRHEGAIGHSSQFCERA
jgi:hypothetical protein